MDGAMTALMTNRPLSLALALSFLALHGACAAPDDEVETGEAVAARAAAVENQPIPEDTGFPLPPPRVPADPRLPRRAGLRTLRVSLTNLVTALSGTRISLDASGHAPTIYQGTHAVCHRPPEYRQAVNDCAEFIGARRTRCLNDADVRYPEVCVRQPTAYHSYVAWGGVIENLAPELEPKCFAFEPIHHDSWAGPMTIVVNQVSATLGPDNVSLRAYTTRYQQTHLVMDVDLVSPQPTAYCSIPGAVGCPNLELSDMHVQLTLQVLSPTADRQGIRFATQNAIFSFGRNLNGIPDWLVTAFYDVDAKIRDKAETKLEDAIRERRDELSTGLTRAIDTLAGPDFPGFKVIDEVIAYDGDLIIHYEPLGASPPSLPTAR
jgi:hypothetical protein